MTGCSLVGSSGTSPREWRAGLSFNMIAQAATVRPHALYLLPRAAARLVPSPRWPETALGTIRNCHAISALKLVAGTFVRVATAFALVNYQGDKQDIAAMEPIRNKTIVFPWGQQTYVQIEQADVSDNHEYAAPSNYPRVVRTVRFVNPDARQNIGTGKRV